MSEEEVEVVAAALMASRHPDAPLSYPEVIWAVKTGSDPRVLEGLRRDARAAISALDNHRIDRDMARRGMYRLRPDERRNVVPASPIQDDQEKGR